MKSRPKISIYSNHRIREFFTLSTQIKTQRNVEHYQVLSSVDGIYQVQIIFEDGTEIVDEGDLFYFNVNYVITKNTDWI